MADIASAVRAHLDRYHKTGRSTVTQIDEFYNLLEALLADRDALVSADVLPPVVSAKAPVSTVVDSTTAVVDNT